MKSGEMTAVNAAEVAKDIVVAVVTNPTSRVGITEVNGKDLASLPKTIYKAVRDADAQWWKERTPGEMGG